MVSSRVIPCLLLDGKGLVKTTKFKDPKYVGDPINAVRIFNDKLVDELVFLDISASSENRPPNFDHIKQIAEEAFIPFGYGGGIGTIEDAEKLFNIGVEKVIVNSAALRTPDFVSQLANRFGGQSVVVSIDVKKGLFGGKQVFSRTVKGFEKDPITWAKTAAEKGAGEILLNSVGCDGCQSGYDLELIASVSRAVSVPLVAAGGAGCLDDLKSAITAGAAAAAAGSLFVFKGKHRAVLISYPQQNELRELFPVNE